MTKDLFTFLNIMYRFTFLYLVDGSLIHGGIGLVLKKNGGINILTQRIPVLWKHKYKHEKLTMFKSLQFIPYEN